MESHGITRNRWISDFWGGVFSGVKDGQMGIFTDPWEIGFGKYSWKMLKERQRGRPLPPMRILSMSKWHLNLEALSLAVALELADRTWLPSWNATPWLKACSQCMCLMCPLQFHQFHPFHQFQVKLDSSWVWWPNCCSNYDGFKRSMRFGSAPKAKPIFVASGKRHGWRDDPRVAEDPILNPYRVRMLMLPNEDGRRGDLRRMFWQMFRKICFAKV